MIETDFRVHDNCKHISRQNLLLWSLSYLEEHNWTFRNVKHVLLSLKHTLKVRTVRLIDYYCPTSPNALAFTYSAHPSFCDFAATTTLSTLSTTVAHTYRYISLPVSLRPSHKYPATRTACKLTTPVQSRSSFY